MFLPFAPMIVGMHVLVATTGNVPRIDIEKTCRASEKTIKEVFGSSDMGNVFESCMVVLKEMHLITGTYEGSPAELSSGSV